MNKSITQVNHSQSRETEKFSKDEELIFNELVKKHSSGLSRFILRHIGNTGDTEDLVQQSFVEAVQAYRSFRGESQLSTWLYGIAMNLIRNYLSRSQYRKYRMVEDVELENVSAEDLIGHSQIRPDEKAAQTEMLLHLQTALSELPQKMQDLILLASVEALSYEEIALALTIPIGTVRSRLSRTRAALIKQMARHGVDISKNNYIEN